jgi:hypothetical protein
MLLAGIGFSFFICCVNAGPSFALDAHGVTTEAVVIDVDDANARLTRVIVEFTAEDGERVTAECITCSSSELVETDTVDVRYDPASPESHVEDANRPGGRWTMIGALIAIAVLSIAALIVGWGAIKRFFASP